MKKLLLLCVVGACGQSFKVEPVKVEPIHMTIDVNLHDGSPSEPAKPHKR